MNAFPRDRALDTFRGLTVFCMVFVNLPGSWSHQYEFLQHAKWNGLKPADLIFPTFLWILGYSLYLFQKNLGPNLKFPWIRFFGIFGMGLFLNAFPNISWEDFRIPGVLQRIAVVYAFLFFLTRPKAGNQMNFLVVVLFASGIYTLLVHGLEKDPSLGWIFSWKSEPDPANNPASLLDQFILRNHLWKEAKTFDPEGILSTTNALASASLGYFVAKTNREKSYPLAWYWVFNLSLALIGVLLHSTLISWNKSLWTLSFVLTCGGFSGICYQICQIFFSQKSFGINLYGKHALFIFFITGVIARTKSYALKRKEIFLWLQSLDLDKKQASVAFTVLFFLGFTGILVIYSGIWRIFTIRLQAIFRLSSKVDK